MSSSSMGELLFVYGTLRKNLSSEMSDLLARYSVYVGEGRIQGELYDLGRYPGALLKDGCSDMVHGEVYALNIHHAPRTWQTLDHYEGCGSDCQEPHEYRRHAVRVFLDDGNTADAWAYVLTNLPAAAVRVPGGDYLAWRRDREKGKD